MEKNDEPSREDECLCAGLPFQDTRPFEAKDLEILRRWRRHLHIRALIWLLAIPLPVVFPLAFGWAEESLRLYPRGGLFSAILSVSIFAAMLGAAWAILCARENFSCARKLKRCARQGGVRRFQGIIRWHDTSDASIPILASSGLLSRDANETTTLELFSEQDAVFQVNGRTATRWINVRVTRGATRPESPVELAVPPQWYQAGPGVELERRRLTPAEVEEVRQYGRVKLPWISAVSSVILMLWIGGHVDNLVVRWLSGPRFSGLLGAAALISIPVVRRFRHARRIAELYRHDAEDAWAIIVTPNAVGEGAASAETREARQFEFLPATQAMWTIDGRPAGWRNKS